MKVDWRQNYQRLNWSTKNVRSFTIVHNIFSGFLLSKEMILFFVRTQLWEDITSDSKKRSQFSLKIRIQRRWRSSTHQNIEFILAHYETRKNISQTKNFLNKLVFYFSYPPFHQDLKEYLIRPQESMQTFRRKFWVSFMSPGNLLHFPWVS